VLASEEALCTAQAKHCKLQLNKEPKFTANSLAASLALLCISIYIQRPEDCSALSGQADNRQTFSELVKQPIAHVQWSM
jgi:hypothetical protein